MIFDVESETKSNLESFLARITPVVPSQFLPKSEIKNLNKQWQPLEREKVPYFTLGDLWDSFDEWSAYGAGVPINFEDTGEALVQYYVPYLSGIQIFTSNRVRDSFSDTPSDESESEKHSRSWDGSSSEDGAFENETKSQLKEKLGHRYFHYFEKSSPYARVPLGDKIYDLAEKHPGLLSLRSVDLSPASWMAVAWYPIYHIPLGKAIKELATCFLTYHTLSSSFQDMDLDDDMASVEKKKSEEEGVVSLAPFGLATYKMQGNVWVSGPDHDKLDSLVSAADSWLKQLRVEHHDFNFFLVNNNRG